MKVKSGEDPALVEERATRLNAFITRTFIDSVLKDRHEGLLYYQVPANIFADDDQNSLDVIQRGFRN